jgi:diguanylate cyclase (GGDEF)-like protein
MKDREDETTVARGDDMVVKPGERRPYLLVLSGTGIGRSLKLEKRGYTIGRGQDVEFRLDDEGISRRHAKVVMLPQGVVMLKDLSSTNGTFVNDRKIEAHPLQEGDRVQLGATITLKFGYEDDVEANVREQLFTAATRDPLTGVYNKRSFQEQMVRAIAFSRRHGQALSLIAFDVDHFKQVNDNYGHLAGDEVLKAVAALFAKELRVEDSLARVGGEEFCVILAGIDLNGATLAAERLRVALARSPIDTGDGDMVPVTVSLGVAQFDVQRHMSVTDLVGEADERLYDAKRTGRNQVQPPPQKPRPRKMNPTVPDGKALEQYLAAAEEAKKQGD